MSETTHRVWDLPVRLFHWTLAGAFVGAYVTHRLGVEYFKYHLWCGYAVIVLVAFRIVWGFIGTRHARFMQFIRGPRATLRYALDLVRSRAPRYPGHNPLGAWMVIALLIGLLLQALTGLFGTDDILNFGPLYGYVSYERSLELTSLHRKFFYWLLAAVALHLAAVLAHWLIGKERLVHAMITGRKSLAHAQADHSIGSSRLWLAAIALCFLIAVLVVVVREAPAPDTDFSYL